MKKALIVAHMPNFIPNFEQNDIRILQEMGYQVTAAFNTNGYERYREKMTVPDVEICHIGFERSPYSRQNFAAYRALKQLIDERGFDLIHCHTPVGGVVARLAARAARKKGTKVIYTAHGFHFYKGAPMLNWLIYCPCEWFCSHFTDILITINQEDYKLACSRMKAKKTALIPGIGVNVQQFSAPLADRQVLRESLGVEQDDVLVLSVGELIKRKNHSIIFEVVDSIENDKLQCRIVGSGELEQMLTQQIVQKGYRSCQLLGYRNDVQRLYKAADIFVFPSFQEGLPVALLEAMASGLPIVASDIRGNNECVKAGENGILCAPQDAAAFADAIKTLADSKELRERFGAASVRRAELFSTERVQEKMREIYTVIEKGTANNLVEAKQ